MTKTRLFTIGHSNHALEQLIQLLKTAGVTAVADVRSQPFSRWLPQFNRSELEQSLPERGITYVFLGRELGGRPQDPRLYDTQGRVDYARVRTTGAFQEGIGKLRAALDDFVVAMLCSEEDPLDCHRSLMIAPALIKAGMTPAHLRADGSSESTSELEERLLAETKVGVGILDGLFATMVTEEERSRFLEEAYRVQAVRRAYRRQTERSNDLFSGTTYEDLPE